MMDLLLATSGGEAQAASGGYVDDVFSAYTYTGNGGTQTINNGIDLAGNGGLVWTKVRDRIDDHEFIDTVRGRAFSLESNTVDAQATSSVGTSLIAFNSNGYSLGTNGSVNVNENGAPFISWTFRRAPKFFDIVTYTGNGASNRALSHQLNADVGMVMVKATSTTGDWRVFHRSATGDLVLNTTAAQTASKANIPSATSSTFTVNGSANTNGVQYVAYLFAHDPSAEGIIQCGSYVGNEMNGDAGVSVNLGWEPQWLLVKGSDTAYDWYMADDMRGFEAEPPHDGGFKYLRPNLPNAEVSSTQVIAKTSTGFKTVNSVGGVNQLNKTYIYLAIRRPNKPPTSGTQVYNAIARTGTGAAATVTGVGFAPDLVIPTVLISSGGNGSTFHDRLRGKQNILFPTGPNVELERTDTNMYFRFGSDGIEVGVDTTSYINYTGYPYINWFFRRAKGFFDVVCYTGTGSASTVSHNLGVAPELMIVKARSGDNQPWVIYHKDIGNGNYLKLDTTTPSPSASLWNNTTPTSTSFTVGGWVTVNLPVGRTYVAYLFATLPGISKVGSYTGNGTSQTINCGFSTGARFILVKRTDATGDWYVWDSVRGIIAANDPHLSLNTAAAEVTTDDSVDPDASGFIVNQNTATNINVNGGQYIFFAIA